MKIPFLRREKKYLIVEILPERERALLFGVNDDKNIRFRREWTNFSLPKFVASLRPFQNHYNVIVVAESSASFSIQIPVELKRKVFDSPLTSEELENVLGQTVSKVFNQHREQASRELGVDELDTVLIISRVRSFKVDGHQVVNPVGFQAQNVRAVIELVFTKRDLYQSLRPLFERRQDFFFTESARAMLHALERVYPLPIGIVTLEHAPSRFFILESVATGTSIYRGKMKWSVGHFLEELCSEWAFTPRVAEEVYRSYFKGGISDRAGRRIERLWKPVAESLFRELKRTRLRGSVVLHNSTHREIPRFLLGRQSGINLIEPPLTTVLKRTGFDTDLSGWPMPSSALFVRLAPFFEFYHRNDDLEINHWLRRRLHWLGATMG